MTYALAILFGLSTLAAWTWRTQAARLKLKLLEERDRKRTAWAPIGGVAGSSYEVACKCDCGKSIDIVFVNTMNRVTAS